MNSINLEISEPASDVIHLTSREDGKLTEVVGDGSVFTDGQHSYLVTRANTVGLHRLGSVDGFYISETAA